MLAAGDRVGLAGERLGALLLQRGAAGGSRLQARGLVLQRAQRAQPRLGGGVRLAVVAGGERREFGEARRVPLLALQLIRLQRLQLVHGGLAARVLASPLLQRALQLERARLGRGDLRRLRL